MTSIFSSFPPTWETRKKRLGRSNPTKKSRVSPAKSCLRMSSFTRGVAVAVKAATGGRPTRSTASRIFM